MFRLSREVFLDDTGATTEEGILMVVMASFAVLLLAIIQSDPVRDKLAEIVHQALESSG
jgi:hypothetical protein